MGKISLWGMMLLFFSGGIWFLSSLAMPFGACNITCEWAWFLSFNLFVISLILIGIDTLILSKIKYPKAETVMFKPLKSAKLHVAIIAYNEAKSIGKVVKDFKDRPEVDKVIVIDNNSTDGTALKAIDAGAAVCFEMIQGYDATCIRALIEGSQDSDLMVLVEGDSTFRARDLPKMLSYIENCHVALGNRNNVELVDRKTQLNDFLIYGNIFLAKLLQSKYYGKTRLTDVGTTYKLMRSDFVRKLLPQLKVYKGHAYNPFSMEVFIKNGKVVEVPVTFTTRIGESKGANRGYWPSFIVGLQMWKNILFD